MVNTVVSPKQNPEVCTKHLYIFEFIDEYFHSLQHSQLLTTLVLIKVGFSQVSLVFKRDRQGQGVWKNNKKEKETCQNEL